MKYLYILFLFFLTACATGPSIAEGIAVLEMTETDTGPVFKVYAYNNYYDDNRLHYKSIVDTDGHGKQFFVEHSFRFEEACCINRDVITITVDYDFIKKHRHGFSLIAHTENDRIVYFYVQEKNINNLLASLD